MKGEGVQTVQRKRFRDVAIGEKFDFLPGCTEPFWTKTGTGEATSHDEWTGLQKSRIAWNAWVWVEAKR